MAGMTFHLWGISHHTAPVEIREKLAFSEEEIKSSLKKIMNNKFIHEAFLISTCNRTELCLVMETGSNARDKIETILKGLKGDLSSEYLQFSYHLAEEAAISHLFKVASGLDSMILGESEILGQVKRAFQWAREAKASGVYLNKLLNLVIKSGKRVRSETPLGEGSLSIAFASVELARRIFKGLKEKKALLIGAGKIGELTAKSLQKRSIKEVYIINRTYSKAFRVAQQLGAKAIFWEKLSQIIREIDFIICSTGDKGHVITKELAQKLGLDQKLSPTILVDIAVPRDVDPRVKEIENIFLYDIDDLKDIVQESIRKRQRAVPKAMQIIYSEKNDFINWRHYLKIRPTLIALKERASQHVKTELLCHKNKLDQQQFTFLKQALEGLSERFIKDYARILKKHSNGYIDGNVLFDIVREMFSLQEQKKQTDETKSL